MDKCAFIIYKRVIDLNGQCASIIYKGTIDLNGQMGIHNL